jgi:hypothetical protein
MPPLIRLSLLLGATVSKLCALVSVYDYPDAMPTSSAYQVEVDGKVIRPLETSRGAVLSFGLDGRTEVTVTLPSTPKSVVIRPLSAGVTPTIDGRTLRFELDQPRNLSVEIDRDLQNPLLVFANPIRQPPRRDAPGVRFFEGGKIHEVGELLVASDETIYLEGGAVVRGTVRARNAGNIRICGPGILDASTRQHKINHLVVRECENVLLQDFLILDPLGWTIHLSASKGVRLENTHVIGWRANSDGLDIEYSRDVTATGCFWRTNDDCIAVKAIYPSGVQNIPFEEMINPETLGGHQIPRQPGDEMGDILIEDCVLWNDQGGQGFEIGFELRIDAIRNITFRDSDIIHVSGGAFTIHNGDRAVISDILIEDVRIENPDRLIDFHVGLSIYSDDCPRAYQRSNPKRQPPPHRPEVATNPWQWYVPPTHEIARYEPHRGAVRKVILRQVQALKVPKRSSILQGFSERKGLADITIEDLVIAGEPVNAADDLDLYQKHVSHLTFTNTR